MKLSSFESIPLFKPLVWLGLFAIAMGYLEAIVVMYLRELFYAGGFSFPLSPIPPNILFTEILREACTLVMLASLAAAASRGFHLWLSYFLFTFGVWDVFYYIGLKSLLGWPPSFLTWDILFLIPITWTGPVLSPLIAALTMIALSLLFINLLTKYGIVRTGVLQWVLLILGALVIFITYVWDFGWIILKDGFYRNFMGLAENAEFNKTVSTYVPDDYHWGLFAIGEVFILLASALIWRKTRSASVI
jgi:hypothetical protein